MDGTIQISTVIQSVGGVLVAVVGAYVMLAKYTLAQKERELETRDSKLQQDVAKVSVRLGEVERKQTHIELTVAVAKESHDNLANDVRQITATMLTRTEWELAREVDKSDREAMKTTLNQILSAVRTNRASSYSALSIPPTKK